MLNIIFVVIGAILIYRANKIIMLPYQASVTIRATIGFKRANRGIGDD